MRPNAASCDIGLGVKTATNCGATGPPGTREADDALPSLARRFILGIRMSTLPSEKVPLFHRPWLLNAVMLVGLLAASFFLPDEVFGVDSTFAIHTLQFGTAWWAY